MIRIIIAAALVFAGAGLAAAQTTLRVGDQKGNSQAVMEAAGVLKDVPYKIEWKEFPAAAPLLGALSAGAIETGLVGDYFLFEVNLQSPGGELFPSLTFVQRDELIAGLDLYIPVDPSDMSEQIQAEYFRCQTAAEEGMAKLRAVWNTVPPVLRGALENAKERRWKPRAKEVDAANQSAIQ